MYLPLRHFSSPTTLRDCWCRRRRGHQGTGVLSPHPVRSETHCVCYNSTTSTVSLSLMGDRVILLNLELVQIGGLFLFWTLTSVVAGLNMSTGCFSPPSFPSVFQYPLGTDTYYSVPLQTRTVGKTTREHFGQPFWSTRPRPSTRSDRTR